MTVTIQIHTVRNAYRVVSQQGEATMEVASFQSAERLARFTFGKDVQITREIAEW